MNKKILNEIDQMKYLFGYKRGVVISEQKSLLTEALNPVRSGYQDVLNYYSGGTDTGWTIDDSSIEVRDEPNNKDGSFIVDSTNPDDTDCFMKFIDNGFVSIRNCKSSKGKEVFMIKGTWSWDGSKPVLKFKGEYITKNAKGYVQDTDTGYTDTKIMGIGASGPIVKKLQSWLVQNGYGTAEEVGGNAACTGTTAWQSCDGIYGGKTKAAVKKFQQDSDISDDGIFGQETYDALPFDFEYTDIFPSS